MVQIFRRFTRAKMIYVQLDKYFDPFKKNINAEAEDGLPDRLQNQVSVIADVNAPGIAEITANDETLTRIRTEIRNMAQVKEVQNMLTQEMFERMDLKMRFKRPEITFNGGLSI